MQALQVADEKPSDPLVQDTSGFSKFEDQGNMRISEARDKSQGRPNSSTVGRQVVWLTRKKTRKS